MLPNHSPTSDTVLIIQPGLSMELTDHGNVQIFNQYKTLLIHTTITALSACNVFSQPRSIQEGIELLKIFSARKHPMIDALEIISSLLRANVLQLASAQKPFFSHKPNSFFSPKIHIKMLNDTARTNAYIKAIHDIVKPGDVVLDLGTGTGVLAIAAAQAGAKKVYAIEATRMGICAQTLFEANHVADRIQLIQGWSTNVTLPEQVDVFVSEIIGSQIFDESILRITQDAIDRFVKPGARFIPEKIDVHAVPINIPSEIINKYNFSLPQCVQWEKDYGICFTPLTQINRNKPLQFQLLPQEARAWMNNMDAIFLCSVDLREGLRVFQSATIKQKYAAISNMQFNGVLLAFTAQLGTYSISTLPNIVLDSNHWHAPVTVFTAPITAKAGDTLEIQYSLNGNIEIQRLLNKDFYVEKTPEAV